jgi:hypothetical protein
MKKVLLFSLLLLFSTIAVFAYETVIIKYPSGELWEKAYYKKIGSEAILQYVPKGQTHENWTRSIILHSYNDSGYPVRTFIANDLARMSQTNPTSGYKYLKLADTDSIAGRCTSDYKNIKAQCEFYRVTRVHNGIVSLHYINRNKNDFMSNYQQWYDIIKRAKYYNSYYRDERTFDKSEYFEL